jgi:tyrosyl-tRNA synthetase
MRLLQQRLAEEVTVMVHSREDYDAAVEASQILFGKATSESLRNISEDNFLSVFEGVPQGNISKDELNEGIGVLDLLAAKTGFLKSNGEARRALKEGSISINKEKISEDFTPSANDLINGKYILLQRGKKNYFLVVVE